MKGVGTGPPATDERDEARLVEGSGTSNVVVSLRS